MTETDVVVAGSGCGALTAAVVAAKSGLKVTLVEKTEYFGGTTAYSAGMLWIPNNPHVMEMGQNDDRERALRYLNNVVGVLARPEHLASYVDNGPRMVEFMEKNTEVRFQGTPYPDYKPELDGALLAGRSIETLPYDGRKLGNLFPRLRPPLKETSLMGGMMISLTDFYHLTNARKSMASARHSMGIVARYFMDRLSHPRGTRVTGGNALIARLLRSALDAGVDLRINSPAKRLIRNGDRVVGVVIENEGREIEIRARLGVVLGTGGFSHDPELKKLFIPFPEQHETMMPPGNRGDGLKMAMHEGAIMGDRTFQNFLGTQITLMKKRDGSISKMSFTGLDRPSPGFIMVNKSGRRYVNEALPYNDMTQAMNSTGSVPTYIVCDHVRLRKYGLGLIRMGPAFLRPLDEFIESGYLTHAGSIRELAQKIGVDADNLEATVNRNNEFATTGKDLDFGKGDSLIDRFLGDANNKPNPNLGPITTPPYYAVEMKPGNLGTFRGLVTDGNANVLDGNGRPIVGLYACGCDMHPAFSGTYPGGGSSLGPGMTFGFVAAMHIARQYV